jgi:hypothetical protein
MESCSDDINRDPLTISHLAVGMDDMTGLLGGEVVDIGTFVGVRHLVIDGELSCAVARKALHFRCAACPIPNMGP